MLALAGALQPLAGRVGRAPGTGAGEPSFSSHCTNHQPLDTGQNHFSSLRFCVLICKMGTVSQGWCEILMLFYL